jgi:DNA-directed RNA polymerase subunit RPC12/RpoP
MPRGRPRTRQEGDLCEECGINPVRNKGYTLAGTIRYDSRCTTCHKGNYEFPWLKHRGNECEMCGHHPFFQGSLDVHHRDGDRSNNDPENLMTLCATCHRELHQFYHQTGELRKAENMLRKFINALLK